MRGGGLTEEIGRIEEATEQLLARWRQTQETWRDGNAQAMEDNTMAPLAELVGRAVPAISHLSDILQNGVRKARDPDDRQEFL